MSTSKICTFCGQPTPTLICCYCHFDSSSRPEQLVDFGYKAPEAVSFGKTAYKTWLGRTEQYKEFLYGEFDSTTKTFVDVGCGPNKFVEMIKRDFPHVRAVGYDQYQDEGQDIVSIDFEKEKLPFKKNEVDVMLLSHVLEHLERIHFVLENAIETSKKLIVVLPSLSLLQVLAYVARGQIGGLYGLPLLAPKDRHRWIYSLREMDRFIGYYAFKHDLDYKVHYLLHPRSVPILSRAFKRPFVYEAAYILRHRNVS